MPGLTDPDPSPPGSVLQLHCKVFVDDDGGNLLNFAPGRAGEVHEVASCRHGMHVPGRGFNRQDPRCRTLFTFDQAQSLQLGHGAADGRPAGTKSLAQHRFAGHCIAYARALADEILDLRARGALRISHFLHLRAEVCSETLIEELDKFGPADRIGILSLMDHTPGERQFRDVSKLREYMQGKHGVTDADFQRHVDEQRALSLRLGEAHETAAVAAARRYGATLASHDDTTAEQVVRSAVHGAVVAEFPTTPDAARACHDHGIKVMMGAPNLIRGGSHSGNVAAADLAREGLLDIVSSDYVPSSLLSAALMLGDLWGDMARGIATVTATPAEAVGLPDRGRVVPGARADLVRVARIAGAAALRGTWVQGRRVA